FAVAGASVAVPGGETVRTFAPAGDVGREAKFESAEEVVVAEHRVEAGGGLFSLGVLHAGGDVPERVGLDGEVEAQALPGKRADRERGERGVHEVEAVALPVVAVVVVLRIEFSDAEDDQVLLEVLLPVEFLDGEDLFAEAVGGAPE